MTQSLLTNYHNFILCENFNADEFILTNNFLSGHIIEVSGFVEWKHLIRKYYM